MFYTERYKNRSRSDAWRHEGGLARSAAMELGPKGIHVAYFNIDGGVRSALRPEGTLDPDAIAQTYIDVLSQPRSAWSFDVDLRPWTEQF